MIINQHAVILELGAYACALTWTGESDKPTLSTSKHMFTDQDLNRLIELQKWIENKHAFEGAADLVAEAAASTSSCDVCPERSPCEKMTSRPLSRCHRRRQPICRTISSAFEFSGLRNKFFLVCAAVGCVQGEGWASYDVCERMGWNDSKIPKTPQYVPSAHLQHRLILR